MLLMFYLIVNMDRNFSFRKRIACHIPRSCGAMDNASAYGAEDSRFESWQDRLFYSSSFHNFIAFNKTNTSFHAKMDISIFYCINVNLFFAQKGTHTHIKVAYGINVIGTAFQASCLFLAI